MNGYRQPKFFTRGRSVALPSNTQGKSPVRELRTPGSVRGVSGNRHSYRDQYFCGEQYFQYRLPIDPSQMSRFRKRIGASGCEFLLKLTIDAGLITKTIVPASLEAVNVDTTVQEKAIAFPTDGRLYHKARVTLVREAKKAGLRLRQSYERLGKQALVMNARYAHARQMKRARREQKRLRV